MMHLLKRWDAVRDRKDDCIRVQVPMKDHTSMELVFYTADVQLQFEIDGLSETTMIVYGVHRSGAACAGEGNDDDDDDWDSATSDDDDCDMCSRDVACATPVDGDCDMCSSDAASALIDNNGAAAESCDTESDCDDA